jgi:hypothetical protein
METAILCFLKGLAFLSQLMTSWLNKYPVSWIHKNALITRCGRFVKTRVSWTWKGWPNNVKPFTLTCLRFHTRFNSIWKNRIWFIPIIHKTKTILSVWWQFSVKTMFNYVIEKYMFRSIFCYSATFPLQLWKFKCFLELHCFSFRLATRELK